MLGSAATYEIIGLLHDKLLVAKLSDDDIRGVLACFGAYCNITRVCFTNCARITGLGLVPLRGSTSIEMIDLSLVWNTQS